MRLRTLPVGLAGVVYGGALGLETMHFRPGAALMCLAFALLAQIASNFANEYYDYRDGLDRAGREGPRRGVTEGDISPRAMLAATFVTLGLACGVGVALVALWGEWWMYAVGVATAAGVVAYSAGPWPLSRHALGEVAVVVFFGIVPVSLTYLLMGGRWEWPVWCFAAGIGLMGANVLIVNNFRDIDDDRVVGKVTLAVVLGRTGAAALYAAFGLLALMLTLAPWLAASQWWWPFPLLYLTVHTAVSLRLLRAARPGAPERMLGRRLTPLLGVTAMSMFVYSLGLAVVTLIP